MHTIVEHQNSVKELSICCLAMLWKNQSKQIDLPLAGGATGRILKSEPEALSVSAHSREAMIKVSQWARASGRDLNELLCLQIVITAV